MEMVYLVPVPIKSTKVTCTKEVVDGDFQKLMEDPYLNLSCFLLHSRF